MRHRCQGRYKRWFDHLFVSSDFSVDSCTYLHRFRATKSREGSSDHSALVAKLSLDPA